VTKSKTKVLVVDDHPDIADAVAFLLEPHVAEVHVAYDASAALQLARTALPQLVIADLTMPEMDGLELAVKLRELPGLADTYFVALTALDPAKYRTATQIAGFDEHLVKPVTEAQLVGLLGSMSTSRTRGSRDAVER
jgi:CheY-like chemotaxis protein